MVPRLTSEVSQEELDEEEAELEVTEIDLN